MENSRRPDVREGVRERERERERMREFCERKMQMCHDEACMELRQTERSGRS